ncbi:MAG: macro domain-containing protein [Armatimonadetes bacterium]|nr:macro domain-containing protein [Armatimonadota bacterium]
MGEILREKTINGRQLQIVQGDITKEETDAIVNAANSHLAHGGGVAAAIARAAGEALIRESENWVRQHGPVPTGQVAVTTGGNLKAKWVIHAVGPVWAEYAPEEADRLLSAALENSLSAAEERKVSSLSLPAISAGIFGFPKERCAQVLLTTTKAYWEKKPSSSVKVVRFVLFDEATVRAFLSVFDELTKRGIF